MNTIPRLAFALLLIPSLSWGDDAAVDAIKKAGGFVTEVDNGIEVGFHHTKRDLNDAELAVVATANSIVTLNLKDTQITDAGLAHLKNLVNLQRLHLERTAVGDAGLVHLAALPKLNYLNLYGTKVTDVGLDHLKGLKTLRQLYLWKTNVTSDGCAKLKQSLPELRILRGAAIEALLKEAEKQEPEKLVELKWNPSGAERPPKSVSGASTTVTFVNTKDKMVKLFWVDYGGGLKHYADIAAGETLLRGTYNSATWLITDEKENPLGYFRSTVDPSRAVIPR